MTLFWQLWCCLCWRMSDVYHGGYGGMCGLKEWIKEHNPHKCTLKGTFIKNSCTPKTTRVISYRQICLKVACHLPRNISICCTVSKQISICCTVSKQLGRSHTLCSFLTAQQMLCWEKMTAIIFFRLLCSSCKCNPRHLFCAFHCAWYTIEIFILGIT